MERLDQGHLSTSAIYRQPYLEPRSPAAQAITLTKSLDSEPLQWHGFLE